MSETRRGFLKKLGLLLLVPLAPISLLTQNIKASVAPQVRPGRWKGQIVCHAGEALFAGDIVTIRDGMAFRMKTTDGKTGRII